MANTRARLLGPPPNDDDTAATPPVYQIAGHRSGEGAGSVLEQLRNDPSRKASETDVERRPGLDERSGDDN